MSTVKAVCKNLISKYGSRFFLNLTQRLRCYPVNTCKVILKKNNIIYANIDPEIYIVEKSLALAEIEQLQSLTECRKSLAFGEDML